MADLLEKLKQKYVSVLHAINKNDIKVRNIHVENDKLVIRGEAPNEEAKNQFWDAVKKVDPNYKDLNADISVSPVAQSAPGKADVKEAAGRSSQATPIPPGVTPASGGTRTYTVKKGDTLSKISKEHYGDANQYMKIFEANRDQLKDPDKIYPGQELRIP